MTQTQLSQDFSLGVRSHCRSRLPPRITLKAAMKSHHGFFFLFFFLLPTKKHLVYKGFSLLIYQHKMNQHII